MHVETNYIMDAIKGRRSRRAFSDRSISEDTVKDIIEAGRYAPSALNKQPWKFIVIAKKEVIRELSEIIKEKTRKIARFLPLLKLLKFSLRDPQVIGAIKKTIAGGEDPVFYKAPLLIIIASAKNSGPFAPKDCALASQNMMLYAHSIGIGSCYIGRADILMMSGAAKRKISLPAGDRIQCALIFGYAAEGGNKAFAPERRRDNIINWVR